MRRAVVLFVVVAMCLVGVRGYAQLRTTGPATFSGGGTVHLMGMSIAADHIDMKTLGFNAPAPAIASAVFRGHVTVTQDGVTVRADEATYDPTTHEVELTGNVRMAVPATAVPAR